MINSRRLVSISRALDVCLENFIMPEMARPHPLISLLAAINQTRNGGFARGSFVMGIVPPVIVDLFCRSPEHRREMELVIWDALASIGGVYMPEPSYLDKLMIEGDASVLDSAVGKLSAQFLMVRDDSCYGQLDITGECLTRTTNEEWLVLNQICDQLLQRSLSISILLQRGCERKGMFGKVISPAIMASPDFARLAILRTLGRLDLSKLSFVVPELDMAAKHETYCLETWRSIADSCEKDSRFKVLVLH
jgi:hypothetical protein